MTEYIEREAAIAWFMPYVHAGESIEADVVISDLKGMKAADVEPVQEWISVDERLPENFISVLGYMTDAGEFPPVRECYTVGNAFFFPALGDIHPVSHWCEIPQPTKGE